MKSTVFLVKVLSKSQTNYGFCNKRKNKGFKDIIKAIFETEQ